MNGMNIKIKEMITMDLEVLRELRLRVLVRLGVLRPVKTKADHQDRRISRRF